MLHNNLIFFRFVTILVDKIDFSDIEAKNDADIRLSGHVRFELNHSNLIIVTKIFLNCFQLGWQKLDRGCRLA